MSQLTGKAEFRRYTAVDGISIELRELEKKDLSGLSLWTMARIWEQSQVAITMVVGDTIVATMGILVDEFKQASAWIQTSDHIFKYQKSFYKKVKQELEKAFEELDIIRAQTTVLVDNETSAKFVERLGFEREGTMRSCFHNALDRHIYARLNHGRIN